MTRPKLVIMAKRPAAGAVKTRLARGIGTVAATFFYRHMMQNLLLRLARDARWDTILALTPDTEILSSLWPAHVARMGQGRGDLGRRMQRVFDRLPPGPVIIIGTDIPEITPAIIANAFATLARNDAVVGPCEDGGYWLIGLKRSPRILQIFANVRWSSQHTRADTLANLKACRVGELQWLNDVDGAQDYHRLKQASSRAVLPHSLN